MADSQRGVKIDAVHQVDEEEDEGPAQVDALQQHFSRVVRGARIEECTRRGSTHRRGALPGARGVTNAKGFITSNQCTARRIRR